MSGAAGCDYDSRLSVEGEGLGVISEGLRGGWVYPARIVMELQVRSHLPMLHFHPPASP